MTKGKFRPGLFFTIVWLHLMAVVAIWYGYQYGYSSGDFWWALGVYTFRAVGVSMGYHRYFTHGSFKCGPVTEKVLAFMAESSMEGRHDRWPIDHDQHHWDTEGEWDPHSPSKYPGFKGFLWSHIGWLFFVVNRPPGRLAQISVAKTKRRSSWDNVLHICAVLSGFVVPYVFGGTSALLLAGFAGGVLLLNVTWSINSVCHIWGSRDETYRKTDDTSRDNMFVLILAYIGEAWHNKHHQKADSAYFGWRWYHFDLVKWILLPLEYLGIVWDVKRPPLSF